MNYEVVKVIIFDCFTKILALIFVFYFFKNKRKLLIDKKLLILIIAFVIYAVLISLFGSDFTKSLVGNYYRKDGLMTLFELIGFALVINYFWSNRLKNIIANLFYFSSIVLSLLSIFKLNTFFGNSIYLAGFLSVSLPFGYFLFKANKNKLYLLGLVVTTLAIMFSAVIGAILTLVLFIALVIFFEIKSKLKNIFLVILATAGFLLVSFWIKDYISKNNNVLIFEGRARIFRNLIVSITKNPIGYGWSNVDYAFESVTWPVKINNDVYLDKAHSEILEVLVTTGVVGLVLYLGILIYMLIKSWKLYKITGDFWYLTMFITLNLFIFHSQTNIISITEQIILWIIVGVNLREFK